MLRPTVRRAAGILTLGLAVATLGACSDSDPRDDAPRLEVAWTSDAVGWDSYEARWAASDDIWIYRDYEARALTGVSLGDGSVAWTHPSGEVCDFSEINETGLVAVQSGSDCSTVAVLDSASGEERWSTRLRFPEDTYPTDRGLSVGITERVVTVASHCGVERWSLAGEPLGRLRGRADHGNRDYCRPSATAGEIAIVADRSGLVGHDADSGARLWRRPGRGAEVHRVYSADPLLADVALGGVRAVRTIDPGTGALGPILGRPLPAIGPSPAIADPVGDSVIGAYDDPAGGFAPTYASVVRGWDASTGEESWTRLSTGDDYLGGDASGVYLGRSIPEAEGGDGYAYWVMRWSAGDTEPHTVGWIDDQVLEMVRVGDLLLTGGGYGDPTTAYLLPEESEDLPVPEGTDSFVRPSWDEDDLPEDPLVDPCAGVTPATLRTLGFDDAADRPAPLGCGWVEGDRTLAVRVVVHRPDDDASATDSAQQRVTDALRVAEYVEVDDPGLGDEVWQWSTASVGATDYEDIPGTTSTDARLLVRRANVVVEATFSEGGPYLTGKGAQLPIAGATVQHGLRAAVQEALAAWDVPADADPPAGADGPITVIPEPCGVLARDVRAVLPGTTPVDTTAAGEERLRGCRWREGPYGELVQVTAYAVGPNDLTGADAEAEARAIVAADGGSPVALPVRGPWDEARVTGEYDGYRDAWRLVVRSGNLVLVVQVGLEERQGSRARSTAIGLARTYLAA